MSGSTATGETVDAEILRVLMTRYYHGMSTVIERHGGTVEKFVGDAVLAVFGVPTVHEDDALRAVRAAVEMQERLMELNREFEDRFGTGIAVRIGVNSGEVVTGEPDAREMIVTGDAVNVAARLEQTAEPGEILIGEATYRLVCDAVAAEPVGPLSLKGKAEPVSAWRVVSADPGAAGVARRLDLPLIGRHQELDTLLEAFARAREGNHCELVTVLGAAGSGKSRLIRELVGAIASEATILRGRCLPYGEGITFWPILEMIREAAGIGDDESAAGAREKIAALAHGDEQGAIKARVADLLGLEGQGAGAIQETFLALRSLFEALAAEQPLVLVVDDIHWAEPTLLDVLEYLAGWARAAAILLVCISRPELTEERPGWTTPRDRAMIMVLRPLSRADSEELVSQLLGDETVEGDLIERITEAAEGNPLYVEEFVRMLRDSARADGQNGGSGYLDLVLPPTIEALLAARLDRLEPDERGVVERAAVVGKVFWWGAVAELSAPREAAVGASLQALVRREFVVPEESIFAGEDAFRFSHILMRDAAYGSITKSLRARFHAAFAEWLVRKAGDRLPQYEEIVGYHLEQAFYYEEEIGEDGVRGAELAEAAAAHLASAGRRAARRADMHAAALLLERAGELAPGGEARVEILLDIADCLVEAAEFDRAERVLTRAGEEAEALGSARLQARVTLLRSLLRLSVQPEDWTRTTGVEVEAAIRTLEESADDAGLSLAYLTVGRVHWMNLRVSQTEAALERALDYASNARRDREEARILTLAAIALFFGPLDVDAALLRCDELIGRARSNPLVLSWIWLVKGGLRAMKGDAEAGRDELERAKRKMFELDLPLPLGEAFQICGNAEMITGDMARAERELRSSCELLQKIGEQSLLSTSAALLAQVLCNQRRYGEALEETRVAEQAGDEDDMATQSLWRVARARCLADTGELATAEALMREGLSLISEADFLTWRGDGLVGMAEVFSLGGKRSEAEDAVATAIQLYEQKGNVASARRARAFLDEIAGPPRSRPS
jgi:class 3 adenylate cyclase/tetratricopeptide (TPR) repeat protein